MARFAVASKALRGPFKKLIRNLEITLRKPAVRKFGPIGRKIDAHFRATDSRTAFQAARRAAGVRSVGPKPIPVATSAAVDRTTGRVVAVGHARDNPDIPRQLRSALPETSLERWPVTNCAEVSAASTAIEGGSRLEDLVIRTVRTKEDVEFPPCENCKTWLPGEDLQWML